MSRAWIGRSVVVVAAALMLAGCGPTITVTNNTKVPVRAVITSSDGSETFAPSPGESSSAEVSPGKYTITVIPDADWLAYATQTRQFLNDQLAHSDNLTGPQLLDLVNRLKDIAAKMQQMQNAAGSSASCSGSVNEDGGVSATISIGANGSLAVSCR